MQQFTVWFEYTAKGNYNKCVTKGVLFLQKKLQFMLHTVISKVHF